MATDPKRNLLALFTATDRMDTRQRFEAMQPAPMPLEMFDSVPAWATVCAADNDHNAPLIQFGEVVVAERGRWLPLDGGLFLIEYVSAPATQFDLEKRHCRIVQTRETERGWFAGGIRAGQRGAFVANDGPYADPTKLAEKLVGRVIGILRTASFIDRMAKGGR